MRRFKIALSAAVVLAFVSACSAESPAAELTKPDQVRAKYAVVNHPAAALSDERIEKVAKSACDLVESWGGNTAILDTLAERTPVDGWSTSQVLQLNMFAAQVYCPEIVGKGYGP